MGNPPTGRDDWRCAQGSKAQLSRARRRVFDFLVIVILAILGAWEWAFLFLGIGFWWDVERAIRGEM